MKNRHHVPAQLKPSTVIVDTKLGMIYRVGGPGHLGQTLYLIPRGPGSE